MLTFMVLLCSDDNDEKWQSKLFHKIRHGEFDRSKLQHISADGRHLVESMLLVDPKKRISASEALRHPWIANGNADDHLASAHEKLREKVEGKLSRDSVHKGQGIMGFLFRARKSMGEDFRDSVVSHA